MAKEPMVTRTITTTKAVVMCVDVNTAEPYNEVVTVPRTYKEDKDLLKKVKTILETDTIKVVHVVSKEIIETLYGMTEQEFIRNAKELPKRETKEHTEA